MTTAHLATEIRRKQIVEAARRLITTHGMAALTIQDLADAVDLSEGALYRHFASKEDILLLLVDDIQESLLAMVDQALTGQGTALERLEALLRHHLSYAERRRGVSFIVMAEAMQLTDGTLRRAVDALLQRYLDRVAGVVREAVASGEARPVDPEAAALLFFGMVQASVTRWSIRRRRLSLTEHSAEMWTVYRDGLAAGPAPSRPDTLLEGD